MTLLLPLQALLSSHVVIDFGHEILNAIYYPRRFQAGPMTDQEFVERLGSCFLQAFKVSVARRSPTFRQVGCGL